MKFTINPVRSIISVEQMLEELRSNHIDVTLYIQEELSQILPSLIEDVIKGIYQEKIAEEK